jgi:signal transduction histidine kinase
MPDPAGASESDLLDAARLAELLELTQDAILAADEQQLVMALGIQCAQNLERARLCELAVAAEAGIDLARMQMSQPLDLDRQRIDLLVLLRGALAEQQLATDRHTLRLESDEAEVVGSWDSRRLARVITNLLDNAQKYSPPGSAIALRVRREAATAVVEIHDQGVGIPAADISRIFDRFQRASNVEGSVRGTGIGLASARHFVESHGGTIEVESEERLGSVFRVRLPLDSAP